MIKAHLQLIYKSRLTQIIIGVLIIAFLIFVGVHIYGWLSFNGSTVSFEIDGKTYFQDKYAHYAWDGFLSVCGAFLFLISPLSIVYYFHQNEGFDILCSVRKKKIKFLISQSISISIFLSLLILFLYFLSLSSFYLFLIKPIEPWYRLTENHLFGDFVLGNDGTNMYWYLLFLGLITAILFFVFAFGVSLITLLFPEKKRTIAYVLIYYFILYMTIFDRDNYSGLMYYINDVFPNYQYFWNGILRDFLVYIGIDFLSIVCLLIKERIAKKKITNNLKRMEQ